MPTVKPYSESCEQNRAPILDVLRAELADRTHLLEIGSGTGQHAVMFAAQLPPTASFTFNPTSGPAPLQVAFADASTGVITGWSWDFGDGTSSAARNPSHTYDVPGTYNATLTVTGPGGSDSASTSIDVCCTITLEDLAVRHQPDDRADWA